MHILHTTANVYTNFQVLRMSIATVKIWTRIGLDGLGSANHLPIWAQYYDLHILWSCKCSDAELNCGQITLLKYGRLQITITEYRGRGRKCSRSGSYFPSFQKNIYLKVWFTPKLSTKERKPTKLNPESHLPYRDKGIRCWKTVFFSYLYYKSREFRSQKVLCKPAGTCCLITSHTVVQQAPDGHGYNILNIGVASIYYYSLHVYDSRKYVRRFFLNHIHWVQLTFPKFVVCTRTPAPTTLNRLAYISSRIPVPWHQTTALFFTIFKLICPALSRIIMKMSCASCCAVVNLNSHDRLLVPEEVLSFGWTSCWNLSLHWEHVRVGAERSCILVDLSELKRQTNAINTWR